MYVGQKLTFKDRFKYVSTVRTLAGTLDTLGARWFVCFGTLLSLLREHVLDFSSDVDIGVIGPCQSAIDILSRAYQPMYCIRNDKTGEVLQHSFRCSGTNNITYTLDVYFWVKVGNMYYHTYDVSQERPKNGIPRQYEFKGVPASHFDPTPEELKAYMKNPKMQGAMNKNGTWRSLLEGFEGDGISVCTPFGYGACLDTWYPDWSMRRPQWGVSDTKWIKRVKSCKDLFTGG